MSIPKVRIGIIGCGGIANRKHMPSLAKLHDACEMVAFCDIIEQRAQKAAADYGTTGARVYTDYRQLLGQQGIDVIHVLTPNVSHCEITVAAFAAGKHVMCEKPMAATAADAQQMMDAWKRSGKLFTVGYQNRFRNEIATLHKLCAAGELGEIYFAKALAIRRRNVPTWGVFPNKALQGGGPLIDIGTHALDITLWMMNNYEPVSVTGQAYQKLGTTLRGDEQGNGTPWDPDTYQVEDSAFGYVKMSNGASIFVEASWAINMRVSNEAATMLCGTRAGAEINTFAGPGEPKLILNNVKANSCFDLAMCEKRGVMHFGRDAADEGYLEAAQWLQAILGEGEPLVKPEQAFVVTKVLDGIYQSSETGIAVQL